MSMDWIKGTHDSAIGNYGISKYGESMAGNVLYAKNNQKSCKEFFDFGISGFLLNLSLELFPPLFWSIFV